MGVHVDDARPEGLPPYVGALLDGDGEHEPGVSGPLIIRNDLMSVFQQGVGLDDVSLPERRELLEGAVW